MIKVLALGVICLAGVGALAAATTRPDAVLVQSIDYPVVAGYKSDRLSMVSERSTSPETAIVPHANTPPAVAAAPQPDDVVKPRTADFTPRHWHDPHDRQAKSKKPKSEASKSEASKAEATTTARANSSNRATKKFASAQDCRSDGVASLLRKLSLQPACDR